VKFLWVFFSLLAALNCPALIFFTSSSSSQTAYHADNIDNGSGTNVILSGTFAGDLLGNVSGGFNQSVTISAGGENGEGGGVGGSIYLNPAFPTSRMTPGNVFVNLAWQPDFGNGYFLVNCHGGIGSKNLIYADPDQIIFGAPASGDGYGFTNLQSANVSACMQTLFAANDVLTITGDGTFQSAIPDGTGSMTIPANTAKAGDVYEVCLTGLIKTDGNSDDTLTFRLNVNGTNYPISEYLARFADQDLTLIIDGGKSPVTIQCLTNGTANLIYIPGINRVDALNSDIIAPLVATNIPFDLTQSHSIGYSVQMSLATTTWQTMRCSLVKIKAP